MSKIETIITPPTLDLQSVQQFYQNRDKHFYALPTQRNFVWDLKRQSELIQSLITNYPIGDLCVHFNNGNDEYMDGQQRARTVDRYVNNDFSLSEVLEDVEIVSNSKTMDMKTYQIAGKSFDELDQEIKQVLLTRMLRIERFYNLTDSQINEVILRKNSGMQLTTIAKTRMVGKEVQSFVADISSMDLFVRKVNITQSKKNDFLDEAAVYNILLFETGLDKEYSTVAKDKFAMEIRDLNLLTDEVKSRIESVFNYMESVFPKKHKILTYPNIPSVYELCKVMMDDKVDNREAYKLIDTFYNEATTDFKSHNSIITKSVIKKKTALILDYYNKVK